MSDKMTDARAEIASAEAALRRARQRLIEAEQAFREKTYPPRPTSNYIGFSIVFSIPGKTYHYAAIRVHGDKWYTTGGKIFDSWELLIDWIRVNSVAPGVWITQLGSVDEYKPLWMDK